MEGALLIITPGYKHGLGMSEEIWDQVTPGPQCFRGGCHYGFLAKQNQVCCDSKRSTSFSEKMIQRQALPDPLTSTALLCLWPQSPFVIPQSNHIKQRFPQITLEGVGPCKGSCRRCLLGTLCSSVLGETQPPGPVDADLRCFCVCSQGLG